MSDRSVGSILGLLAVAGCAGGSPAETGRAQQARALALELALRDIPCASDVGGDCRGAPPVRFDPAVLADHDAATSPVGWFDVRDVPPGIRDGDADLLGLLGCGEGEVMVASSDPAGWRCVVEVEDVEEVTPSGGGCDHGVPTGLVDGSFRCEPDPDVRAIASASMRLLEHPFPGSSFLPRIVLDVDGLVVSNREDTRLGQVDVPAGSATKELVLAGGRNPLGPYPDWTGVRVLHVVVRGVVEVDHPSRDVLPFMVQASPGGSPSGGLVVVARDLLSAALAPVVEGGWACTVAGELVVGGQPLCESGASPVVRVRFPAPEEGVARYTVEVTVRGMSMVALRTPW